MREKFRSWSARFHHVKKPILKFYGQKCSFRPTEWVKTNLANRYVRNPGVGRGLERESSVFMRPRVHESMSPRVSAITQTNRTVFKWLSKVITWLRLLRLVIDLKDARQFFNQWQAKPNPIAPCTRNFSRASSELQVIARNCDWFMALFVPVLIGRSNCFAFGFSTVIWKPLYSATPITRTRITRASPLSRTESEFLWIWPNFSVLFTWLTQTRKSQTPR